MGKRKRQKIVSATFLPRVRTGTCDFNYAEEQQGLLQIQGFSHLRFNAKIDYLQNDQSQY